MLSIIIYLVLYVLIVASMLYPAKAASRRALLRALGLVAIVVLGTVMVLIDGYDRTFLGVVLATLALVFVPFWIRGFARPHVQYVKAYGNEQYKNQSLQRR